jgi:hypothetical protein
MSAMPDQPVNLYMSYSHRDEVLRDELAKHLSILRRQGVISDWHDRRIEPGAEWKAEIDRHLDSAQIILLLISSDFLASDYCYGVEMKLAQGRHDTGESVVIPILLRPTDWAGAPFSKLQALPKDARPVTTWANQDEAFTNIAQGIRRVAERLRAKTGVQVEAPAPIPPTVSNIPSRDPYFFNRGTLLERLHDALTSEQPDPQALIGAGGVGKSSLAIEYFYRHAGDYRLAWWVRAGDAEALAGDYVELARALRLPPRGAMDRGAMVQSVRDWLENHAGWLLIFDDAQGADELRDYLPRSKTGHVLITSRHTSWVAVARQWFVDPLSRGEAAEFLLRRTEQSDAAAATALAEALGDMPLALALAGAYIEETGGTLSGYLELMRRSKTQVLSGLSEQNMRTARRFLERAGAEVRSSEGNELEVVSAPISRLAAHVPLPVLFANGSAEDDDFLEFARRLRPSTVKPETGEPWMAGILFYRQPPDALALTRMAEAQLRSRFVTIPIPLAAVENTLTTNADCGSLLADYADRYLPGANLFNDRNAISDTTTFFGRMELLHRLEQDLLKFQGIGLFGLRKSGKTSVLLQLGMILRGNPVVHVDLQIYGGKPRYGAELFNEIVGRLCELLLARGGERPPEIEPFPASAAAAGLAVRFEGQVSLLAGKLREAGYAMPIICLMDEVERILPQPADSREKVEEFNAFFGALRALCQQKRQLSLLVTDVHPDCNRINHWPQPGAATNPVYKFFKDEFLKPFTADETATMLTSIGRLMGRQQPFDEETLAEIHRISGGHPFIARQLAYLLYLKVRPGEGETIAWSRSQPYLKRALKDSSTLRDYVDAGIWDDLVKRRFESAMAILKALACARDGWIAETVLHRQIGDRVTQSQLWDALQRLVEVGLVEQNESADEDRYRIRLILLTEWLRMDLSHDEVREWQAA